MNQLSKTLVHSCLQLRQLWFCLVLMLAGAGMAMAQTPQAIWTADNSTLTFINSATQYVADNKFNGQDVTAVWSGELVTASGNATPAWYDTVSSALTKVVFDSSFASVRPTSLRSWFQSCHKLTAIEGISNLNTSEATSMSQMFFGSSALTTLNLSNFETRAVTDMGGMFSGCTALTSLDVSNFDTSNVTNMGGMFSACSALTSLDVSNFDTGAVTVIGGLFLGCSSLTSLDVSNFDTSNATGMSYMFAYCRSLTSLDLSNFDTSSVTDMNYMFAGCSSLTTIICDSTWTATNSSDMFAGCTSLVGGAGTAYDASHVDVAYAHPDGGTANPGYFTLPTPQAIWTADNTLTFIYGPQYADGGTFNGQTVTAVWSGADVTASGYANPAWNSTVSPSLTKVVFDSSFASVRPTSLVAWFNECRQLTEIKGMSNLNTSEVTSMNSMFNYCSSLTSLDVSNFDTSNVTDMTSMFSSCSALTTLDVSNFDTSKVRFYIDMFYGCSRLTTIFCDDTWTQTNSSDMFAGCTSLVGGAGTAYDESHVDAAYAHPDGSNKGYFTRSPVQAIWTEDNTLTFINGPHYDADGKFNGKTVKAVWSGKAVTASGNANPAWYSTVRSALTKVVFDRSFESVRPTSLFRWFASCSKLTAIEDISYLNTSEVTNMSSMFFGCRTLESLDVSNFNTSNVTDMSYMFYYCSSLTSLDLSNFDTSNVTKMNYLFYSCSSLTSLDVSNFNTSNVTDMSYMFYGCKSLGSLDVSNFNTSNVTAMASMFQNCTSLTSLDVSNIDTSNVTNMGYMFYGCKSLGSLDLSHFNTSNVTDMSYMFNGCSSLTSLNLSNFKTSNVTYMSSMFKDCLSLTSLDLSNFYNSKVTNMSYMFQGCSALTSLDLSNFNTSEVIRMDNMFKSCSSLTTIICDSTWTPTISSTDMFLDCASLVGGAGTTYDPSHVDKAYAHPDGGSANPGYFTSSTEVITANKPDDKQTYWATYYYSGSNTVALPAAEQSVTIYTAEYSEEGQRTLILTEVTDGVIKAGQGVIIESNQSNVTMKHSLTRMAIDDFFAKNELKGRDNACALPTDEGTIYTMGKVGGQLGFYKYTGSQLKSRRAYLAIPAGSEAGIRIRFDGEDTATGLDEVQSTKDNVQSTKYKVQSTGIYDLQGRRVVNPTKGIYIVNGKKVYMK